MSDTPKPGVCRKCGARFVGTPEQPPASTLCRYCELTDCRTRIAELEAENARLAAALVKYGCHLIDCAACDAGLKEAKCDCGLVEIENQNSTALRDLLAPTVELLKRAATFACGVDELWREAARLEAVMKGEAK